MTLRRYLRDKPETWFVTPVLLAEIVSDRLPYLLVAEEQAENILLLKRRLQAPVEKKRQLQISADMPSGYLNPTITEAQLALGRLLHDHFKTLQEMGLVPKATTKVDVTTRGAGHELFSFLTPEQAVALKRLEAAVDAGKIDVLEVYNAVGPLFAKEQERQERLVQEGGKR
jgi:hypothetical protein